MNNMNEAVAQVKANAARRKFRMSLLDLCVKVVASSEVMIGTDKVQQRLLGMQASTVKTQILFELSRSTYGTLVHPATIHRVVLLKILVHSSLIKFDFAVCGNTLGKAVTERVWKILAEKAGQSLRCVHDLRITASTLKSRTVAWCLPFVAKMPKLQQLRLTTLCVTSRDQLVQLLEAAPQLRRLQVQLHNNSINYYSLAARGMTQLEELVLGHNLAPGLGNQNIDVEVLVTKLPHLKVNCVWADRLNPEPNWIWHTSTSIFKAPKAETIPLEHLCVREDSYFEFTRVQLANVKHLLLSESASGIRRAYLWPFDQLQTLHLRYYNFTGYGKYKLEMLGTGITTLILDAHRDRYSYFNEDRTLDLFAVLDCCKNLTDLVIRGGSLTITSREIQLENLPLRRLELTSVSMQDDTIALCWLLTAPRLEEIALKHLKSFCLLDFEVVAMQVEFGLSLVNLHRFHMSATSRPFIQNFDDKIVDFAISVLVSCRNLSSAKVDLDFGGERAAEVMALVNMINL